MTPEIPVRRTFVQAAVRAALLVLIAVIPAEAQQFRIQTTPQLLFPVSDSDVFGLGFGAALSLSAELSDNLAPWTGLRLASVAPAARDLDSSLIVASIAAGLEYFAFPTARLKIGARAGGGVYMGSYRSGTERIPTGNLAWEGGIDAGYRLSPGLTLSGGISYIDLRQQVGSFFNGLSVSVRVDLALESTGSGGRATLEDASSTPIYPILAESYNDTPFGTVTIRNGESAEIRNVQVWFSADGYTSAPRLCGETARLSRGEAVRYPLYASFSSEVMTVTELLRTTGEVTITYDLLGEEERARGETTVAIANRNAFTWSDPRVLASFVSTNDEAVLDMSKYIAGVVRSESRTEVDSNLQYALALFEGLRLSGIAWSADPQTPYTAMRLAPEEDDYVQYPHQTIAYGTGDSDDLAVLYAAALQSVGVPAAMIPLEDDVLVAARLELPASDVSQFFTDTDELLIADDAAWIPVRISMLREGFLRAWSEGARMTRESAGVDEAFFPLSVAWRTYPAAGVPGIEVRDRRPRQDEVIRAFTNVVDLVVEREVLPRAQAIRNSFGEDGGSGRQHNRLGVLYARYGIYGDALAEFQTAYDLGFRRATVNLGNVAFLLRQYETALAWYERAIQEDPDDSTALIGLARTYYELDRYEETDRYFDRARQVAPELSEKYGYLSARISETVGRASAAADRLGNMIWDEE